jgi:hypothetical protein
MPLVAVKKENALAYVPGSHRSNTIHERYNFGLLNPDAKADVDQVNFFGGCRATDSGHYCRPTAFRCRELGYATG